MANPKLKIIVVVSGAPQTIVANGNQKGEHLMREALKEAGIHDPKLADWTLRFKEGGPPIDPDSRISEAGISDGSTLFLDPNEGGGGQVNVAPVALPPLPEPPSLVDPEISTAKLDRQLADWEANAEIYAERGWLLLGRDQLQVDVAFAAHLPIGDLPDTPALPLAVRFRFQNYDLAPPSLELIDPITRRPLGAPRVAALDFDRLDGDGNPEAAFVGGHPLTGRPFLCKRGVREYHTHFEHSGDDWLLHRDQGIGTLAQLCGVLWRLTTHTVSGLNFAARRVPHDGGGGVAGFGVEFRREDVDALRAQLQAQQQAQEGAEIPIEALPPEFRAQLQAALAPNQG
jgi:hypothetical protein